MPDGEQGRSQLFLRELTEEVRLIFIGVCAFQDAAYVIPGRVFVIPGLTGNLFLPAVVAGSHVIGPVLAGHLPEGVKLDLPVAEHVRIGRTAPGVLVKHIVHHPLTVLGGQVHVIEGNAYLAGHHLGHKAVFLPFAVPVQGNVGVVPVLHEHRKDVVALLFEQISCHRRVHAAGQTDAYLDLGLVHYLSVSSRSFSIKA